MPNYEELYYSARNRYNQAVENKNTIRRRIGELQGQKTQLSKQLQEKQEELTAIRNKELLVRDVIKKVKSIKDNEFPAMQRDLKKTSDAYKKIIKSDMGVADISAIYDTDITATKNNLDSISSEMTKILNGLEKEEKTAQKEVTDCSNKLDSVTQQLNNVGSESVAQRQMEISYAEMKTYEAKWQNGE